MISKLKISKGNKSAKKCRWSAIVNLCMSSGHALYFYQASCLEGGPLLWIWPLYLHVNQKSDDDDDDQVL